MSPVLWTLLGAGLALAGSKLFRRRYSFRAQRPADYASETPAFTLGALEGRFRCEGLLYDYTGRVNTRFTAELNGLEQADGFVFEEDFTYSTGRVALRRWTLSQAADGAITARAPDLQGDGAGVIDGNALRLHYRLRLPDDVGGHVLDVTDWLYLQESGMILNRSQMRKYGVTVLELFAAMIPEEE